MARSKYTYDDFVKSATASGMIGDFDGADLDAARRNPDTAMTLLSYKKDLSSALSSGNDSAAVLARSGIDALRRGYAPVGSSAVSASASAQSAPSSFGTEETKSAPAAQSARSSAVPASPREYSNRDVQRIFEKSMGESGIGDLSDLDTDGDGKTNMRDAVRILRNISAGRGYNEYTRRQNYAVTPDMYEGEYARALGDYLATDANEVYDTDLWNAYAKQYRREGDRAAADVLGQYAGLNGGALPSYAQSAASQQRNYYASQLADRVPEIYDALRSERAGRLSALASAKEQALAEAETAAKYKDTSKLSALGIDVSRYLADEEYSRAMDEALAAAQLGDYTKFDALTGAQTGAAQRDAQRRAAAEAAMSAGDAALFDELYGTGVGDVYRRSEERTAQSTALDNAYKAASLGNLAPLASLWGMSVGELQTLIGASGGASSGSSGASSGVSGVSGASGKSAASGASSSAKIPNVVEYSAKNLKGKNGDLMDYLYSALGSGDITEAQAEELFQKYKGTYTTRKEALKAGAPEDTLTESEWTRAKNSGGSKYSSGAYGNTYAEYLENQVEKGRSYEEPSVSGGSSENSAGLRSAGTYRGTKVGMSK